MASLEYRRYRVKSLWLPSAGTFSAGPEATVQKTLQKTIALAIYTGQGRSQEQVLAMNEKHGEIQKGDHNEGGHGLDGTEEETTSSRRRSKLY